jgi:hypothetical protein
MQQFDFPRGEAASGDAEQIEFEPIGVVQVLMQVVAAKYRARARPACADLGAQYVGMGFQQFRSVHGDSWRAGSSSSSTG